jgi:hypothetical protein
MRFNYLCTCVMLCVCGVRYIVHTHTVRVSPFFFTPQAVEVFFQKTSNDRPHFSIFEEHSLKIEEVRV